MSELRIELSGGRKGYKSGEPLSGQVTWRVDEQPESVELRLFWYTSGKGTQDVEVANTMTFAAPRTSDQRDFTIPLPREPYSFSGTLISLIWAIELIIEPGEHVERKEIVLSSTGKEVVIGGSAITDNDDDDDGSDEDDEDDAAASDASS